VWKPQLGLNSVNYMQKLWPCT